MKKNKITSCLKLFLAMFKIGLFTFGGGYAMVAVFENEFVSNKKWIEQEEFTDLIAIAESTPGPIAINSATYIGYKVAGVLGSIFATLGMIMPSLIVICIISLFFNAFLQITLVAKAFKGIQACVAFLIISAGIKMFLKSKKTVFSCVVFACVCLSVILCALFSVKFSSINYILIGAGLGLLVYLISYANEKMKLKSQKNVGKEEEK
ncbi:MAG: chromate transporter [Clostridia bacterium]|nr:chromate transporter [Clostridia bacterium]